MGILDMTNTINYSRYLVSIRPKIADGYENSPHSRLIQQKNRYENN